MSHRRLYIIQRYSMKVDFSVVVVNSTMLSLNNGIRLGCCK